MDHPVRGWHPYVAWRCFAGGCERELSKCHACISVIHWPGKTQCVRGAGKQRSARIHEGQHSAFRADNPRIYEAEWAIEHHCLVIDALYLQWARKAHGRKDSHWNIGGSIFWRKNCGLRGGVHRERELPGWSRGKSLRLRIKNHIGRQRLARFIFAAAQQHASIGQQRSPMIASQLTWR